MTTDVQSSLLAADLDEILARTAGLWERMRGQTVFITGGTGFFGRWLLESFSEANRRLGLEASVVVLARHPEVFRAKAELLSADPAIQVVRGNVRTLDANTIRAQLGASAPKSFSFVIHAASETTLTANRDNPLAVLDTLVEGTRRVLDFAVQSGAKNFLLVSSGAVYGQQPADLSHVPEDYQGAPDVSSTLAAYCEGKRVAELLCHAYARAAGLDIKIARCFAFVGPYLKLDAHYVIGNFLQDALANRPIEIKGDGTPFRSYLYSADLAIWLWTILLRPDATGTYNVGSDDAYSIFQIARAIAHHAAGHPPVTVLQHPEVSRPAQRYVPDVSRARRELGLEVWTPFDSAVRKTLEFHQNAQRT
jgi:nucleoside-diphosphate-sugar epimerase